MIGDVQPAVAAAAEESRTGIGSETGRGSGSVNGSGRGTESETGIEKGSGIESGIESGTGMGTLGSITAAVRQEGVMTNIPIHDLRPSALESRPPRPGSLEGTSEMLYTGETRSRLFVKIWNRESTLTVSESSIKEMSSLLRIWISAQGTVPQRQRRVTLMPMAPTT